MPPKETPQPMYQSAPVTTPPPVAQATAPVTTSTTPTPVPVVPMTASQIQQTIEESMLLDWLFRIGLSSIFLINSLNALVKPADFTKLLHANLISRSIGHDGIMTNIILVNDLVLGLIILSGWKKKYVWAWAGAWLVLVAGIKILYLA